MRTFRLLTYSCMLGAGSALIGLVIGVLIKPPSSAVASILIVLGLSLFAGAVLLARRFHRSENSA